MKEKVVCSAIRISYLFVDDWNTGNKSRHYHVICGVNWDTIRNSSLYRERKMNYNNGFEEDEGFVTTEDRFVDKISARNIASDAGQVPMIVFPVMPQKTMPLRPEELL